jgi:hypothetical protein
MDVFSVVSVVYLSGRGLCDGLITRPEESYRLWCVIVCDLETSRLRMLKTRKWVVKANGIIIIILPPMLIKKYVRMVYV